MIFFCFCFSFFLSSCFAFFISVFHFSFSFYFFLFCSFLFDFFCFLFLFSVFDLFVFLFPSFFLSLFCNFFFGSGGAGSEVGGVFLFVNFFSFSFFALAPAVGFSPFRVRSSFGGERGVNIFSFIFEDFFFFLNFFLFIFRHFALFCSCRSRDFFCLNGKRDEKREGKII